MRLAIGPAPEGEPQEADDQERLADERDQADGQAVVGHQYRSERRQAELQAIVASINIQP